MPSYTKLFSSIVHSSIWRENNHVRLVWVTMLALADRDGVVDASIPGLADAARVTIAECEEALMKLKEPDPYSRSKANDGRRITDHELGWQLLNHEKYRQMASKEEAKEKAAERQRRKRERHAVSRSVTPRTACHDKAAPAPSPDPVTPLSPPSGGDDPNGSSKSKRSRRKPKVPRPADLAPIERHVEAARKHGLDLASEFKRFCSHHDSHDSRFADWHRALDTWLGNSAAWQKPGKAPGLVQHEDQKLIDECERGIYGDRLKKLAEAGKPDLEAARRIKAQKLARRQQQGATQ